MLTIRKSLDKDREAIIEIVKTLDLSYPSLSFGNFWIAELDGQIVGIANLEEFNDFYFLSSVGVRPDFQHQGLASKLIKECLKSVTKKVYLFTVIPDFFLKLGFKFTTPVPGLPVKSTFSCRECTPETCVCMVK